MTTQSNIDKQLNDLIYDYDNGVGYKEIGVSEARNNTNKEEAVITSKIYMTKREFKEALKTLIESEKLKAKIEELKDLITNMNSLEEVKENPSKMLKYPNSMVIARIRELQKEKDV